MSLERKRVRLGPELVQQPRGALDVREQEGNRPSGKRRHCSIMRQIDRTDNACPTGRFLRAATTVAHACPKTDAGRAPESVVLIHEKGDIPPAAVAPYRRPVAQTDMQTNHLRCADTPRHASSRQPLAYGTFRY